MFFTIPIGIFFLSGYIGASDSLGWNVSSPIDSPMSSGLEHLQDTTLSWFEKIPFLQKPIFDWAMKNNLLALFLFYAMVMFVLAYLYVDRVRVYYGLVRFGKWFIRKEELDKN